MPCTLHTFRCVHFAIETGSTSCLEVLDNFKHHAAQAQGILCKEAVERHITYPVRCPMCEGPIDVEQCRTEAFEALDDLQELIAAAGQQYDYLGRTYYDLSFTCRAKTANSPKAAMVHRQFAINTMSRENDPFFSLWFTTLGSLFAAENLLGRRDSISDLGFHEQLRLDERADQQSDSEPADSSIGVDDLKAVFGIISEIRESIGAVIVTQMTTLLEGVREIAAKSAYPRKPKYDDGIPSRVTMARTIARNRWVARLED
ncbi:hypothetical protein LTR36_003999 [Oleoguttula mirabilis]|uniref:Uncharacterized protein n=1 Tax=Oleoguttula mirabilis TaxID=1507867 RepID=A0AAV9JI88_9PEZI|nr:hypothetical protein LTR36_003999 [Oleoguttula mirabilis]